MTERAQDKGTRLGWRTMRRWLRVVWVGAGLVFTGWLFWSMQAHGVQSATLVSSHSTVVVDSGAVLQFLPQRALPDAPGLVFLPGAMVQPIAYAPLLRAVADAGYPAVLVQLPWRVAPSTGAREVVWARIAAILAQSPNRPWVLAGHSRGGALAAQFAGEHAASLAGLILIGTTHPKAESLAELRIPVTKLYGTRDCVADTASMHANSGLLPPGTHWVRIEGANHSQFGWYGRQLGDCDATISRETQQRDAGAAVIAALTAARGI